ncbi:hypothetical protein [Streptomyces sp. NBC_00454]|uniref:hypothetical protein n=1 Tax=Streptomyces sp. NBC_00454 TaxID=2975747 RepID=UPI0030DF3D3F
MLFRGGFTASPRPRQGLRLQSAAARRRHRVQQVREFRGHPVGAERVRGHLVGDPQRPAEKRAFVFLREQEAPYGQRPVGGQPGPAATMRRW